MNRIPLSDGRWFDEDKATKWNEGTFWDGNNHCSLATGSQWDHEALFRSAGGTWVLQEWSQRQGSVETHTVIDADAAARWLIRNERDLPDELAEYGASLEV